MDGVSGQTVDVLLVEDDPGDALLVREALTGPGDSTVRCHVAADGESAVQFLHQADEFADAPRPRLILLDLNLGGMHGLQVLARLKADEQLKTIPVVVLTSSRHPADVHHSYAHHASAYVVKPVDLDDFGRAINVIDSCFLRLAEPSPVCQETEHPVPGIQLAGSDSLAD